MAKALRNILAALAGLVCAGLIIMAIEWLGHDIYPVPAGVDPNDPSQVSAYVSTLPFQALLFPLVAWIIGSFTGGLLAAMISRRHPMLLSGIVGALILLGAAANFAMISHPLWMIIAAAVGIPSASWLAGHLVRSRRTD